MLGYRKRSFARAHSLLQTLRTNLEDMASLGELQRLLLDEIARAEKKVRELKTELKTLRLSSDRTSVRRSTYLVNRIEGFRQCAYIWRCFGDAIAFLYMDKFALKHTFYSTENTNPKQDAGFIVDKEGVEKEITLMESALARGFPALLVDLTNTIRHGDICLMVGLDPHLIEVKSSKKLDSRGKRQKRNLEKLHAFYETDKTDALRGLSFRRLTHETPERTYVDQLNECIAAALKDGFAIRQPERGLNYIIMTANAPHAGQIIDTLDIEMPWAFFLNEAKSNRSWAPYVPFTLTIEDKEHLWNFIRGNLFILVLLELDVLCQIALEKGYKAKLDLSDDSYPLRVEMPGSEGAGISKHRLTRIGMEFVSPEWVVESSIEVLKRGIEAIEAEDRAIPQHRVDMPEADGGFHRRDI